MSSFACAEPIFSTKFSSPQRGFVTTGDPSPTFQYWTATNDDRADAKHRRAWFWVGGEYPDKNYVLGYLYANQREELVWLLRDLNLGQVLVSRSVVRKPVLTAKMTIDNRGSNIDRAELYFYTAFLNSDGNGYVGEMNVMGRMTLYRIDHGVTGEWTQLADIESKREDLSPKVELSIKDGEVIFSNHPGTKVSAQDRKYEEFSTIAISGLTPNNEVLLLREVSLEGE